MSQERFDELTRALATGVSRRQALKIFAGGVMLSLLGVGRVSAGRGCRRPGQKCTLSYDAERFPVGDCCQYDNRGYFCVQDSAQSGTVYTCQLAYS